MSTATQRAGSSRALGVHIFNPRQRQVDLCGFEASLVYRTSSRTGQAQSRLHTEKPCLKTQTKPNQPPTRKRRFCPEEPAG